MSPNLEEIKSVWFGKSVIHNCQGKQNCYAIGDSGLHNTWDHANYLRSISNDV